MLTIKAVNGMFLKWQPYKFVANETSEFTFA